MRRKNNVSERYISMKEKKMIQHTDLESLVSSILNNSSSMASSSASSSLSSEWRSALPRRFLLFCVNWTVFELSDLLFFDGFKKSGIRTLNLAARRKSSVGRISVSC